MALNEMQVWRYYISDVLYIRFNEKVCNHDNQTYKELAICLAVYNVYIIDLLESKEKKIYF